MILDLFVTDVNGDALKVDDSKAWAQWFTTADRTIRRDHVRVDGVIVATVSTTFVGLGGIGDDPPVLWQTLIFRGPHDRECFRWDTRHEALTGHAQVLAYVREWVK